MKPIRLFISNVQKELEFERAAVAALVSTDPFLLQHCEPVLFEKELSPPNPGKKSYLATLKACQSYVNYTLNKILVCFEDGACGRRFESGMKWAV